MRKQIFFWQCDRPMTHTRLKIFIGNTKVQNKEFLSVFEWYNQYLTMHLLRWHLITNLRVIGAWWAVLEINCPPIFCSYVELYWSPCLENNANNKKKECNAIFNNFLTKRNNSNWVCVISNKISLPNESVAASNRWRYTAKFKNTRYARRWNIFCVLWNFK